MSERYTRQIRKTLNKNYSQAFDEVKKAINTQAKHLNFFQRFKIAMRYLFKKDFSGYTK